MKRKLFPSFTRLLSLLKDGSVREEDLGNALFFFGCTESHVLGPTERTEARSDFLIFKDDPELGQRLHQLIQAAVRVALREGRAVFRPEGMWRTPEMLNGLLTRNGYQSIDVPQDRSVNVLAAPILSEIMQRVNPDLEVAF